MSRKKPQTRRRIWASGLRAEYIAAIYLWLKGYRIIARRFKTPVGEVDLIVLKGSALVFVEVKLRKTFGDALESINAKSRRRITKAAQYFIMHNPQYAEFGMRFDVIALGRGFSLRHLDNAWPAGP